MERIFSFIFSFLLTVSAHSQIRIEKRHYNRGWYISLNDHKKEASARPENFSVASETAAPEPVAEPQAAAPAVIADSAALPAEQPAAAPQPRIANPVKQLQTINHQVTAPLVRQAKRLAPAASVLPRFTNSARSTRSLSGDNDMWGLFGKMLLTILILMLVGALVAAIAEVVLTSLFTTETVEMILGVTLVGLFIIDVLVWIIKHIVKAVSNHRKQKAYSKSSD